MEVDAEGGVDVFGDHAARAEDVGPLVLGPPRRAWRDDVGAATTLGDFSDQKSLAPDGANDETDALEPSLSCRTETANGSERVDDLDDLDSCLLVPAGLNRHLRDYQREGVRFLYRLFASGKGGVLADDMGLGKTVQTVAYLGSVLRSPVAIREASATKKPLLALVVCPTSVLTNWEAELRKWGDAMGEGPLENSRGLADRPDARDETFRVARVHGDAKREQWARIVATVELAVDGATARACVPANVALTSYDTFRLNAAQFAEVPWTTCVFDEAHKLKNEKALVYAAAARLPKCAISPRVGLTGTIMQNTYDELWCLLDWACPGSLGEAKAFREYYSSKMQLGQRHGASEYELGVARERANELKKLLRKYVLTRKKKDVLRDALPSKADNVVFCELAPLQLRVYRRLLDTVEFSLLARADEPCDCESGERRARCCHRMPPEGEPAPLWECYHRVDLGDRAHEDGGCKMCPYCLVLPCMTILAKVSNHLELLKPDPALAQTDPHKFQIQTLVAEMALGEDAGMLGGADRPDGDFQRLSSTQHCGKLAALEKLLRLWHRQNDKVLVFSVSTRLLDILERFMTRHGYVFSRLDGSTNQKHRQTVVDDFNASRSTFAFLLSTRAGGVGLNIVSANRVVIFDPNWNPALDLQAQDRSYRIGQRRDVDVYRLLTSGTLEELVYQRQVYKQQQSNVAVDGVEERRYFEGVQGDKEQKGELFGVANVFAEVARGKHVRMKELVERERRAGEGDGDGNEHEGAPAGPPRYRVEKARDRPAEPRATSDERRGADGAKNVAREGGATGAAEADSRPGEADGVLYEHRHDRIVGTTTEAERQRSRRAVLAARRREDRERTERGAAAETGAERARRAGKRVRERFDGDGGGGGGGGGDASSDPRARAAAAALSRAAAETPEACDARDADDVVAALAAHEGVSVAEMGRRLLSGSTGDRAAMLRAFLVAKRADTGVMLFH